MYATIHRLGILQLGTPVVVCGFVHGDTGPSHELTWALMWHGLSQHSVLSPSCLRMAKGKRRFTA